MKRCALLSPLALTALVLLGLAVPVGAQAQQPGPASATLEPVAHLALPGPISNIWVHKNVVFIGSWTGAKEGVKLIDIADPTHPTLISALPRRVTELGGNQDVMVISADTPAFKGDLLAVGFRGSTNGVDFWDVTDPRQPRLLSLLRTSPGVHRLHVFQREGRIFALLATLGGGLRIVDATDPTRPKILSTWVLQKELQIDPRLGADGGSFCSSVSANTEGTIAYLAYWDAGAVILDISDPGKPRTLGRTLYPLSEEGNTHSLVDADGGRLLITTDWDIESAPLTSSIRVTAPARLSGLHAASELRFTRPLVGTGPIRGEVVYVGSGLPGAALLADPKGKIALLDPGSPDQGPEQVLRAQAAGAIAVLFSNLQSGSAGPNPQITIPGVSLVEEAANALKAALATGEKVEVELFTTPGGGYVRLWDIRDPANPVQAGSFATPATLQFPPPGPGWFTAHEPFVRGDRLYVTWFADGVRVVDIANPAQPREIGHFVPPVGPKLPNCSDPSFCGPFPVVFDVVEHNGLILMTDLQSGLWILRDLPR